MDETIKEKRNNKFKKISAVLKLLVFAVILIGIPAYIYFFQREFLSDFSSIKDMRLWLEQYKHVSMLVYVGAQVLQIIICIIPGQALQFASGYLFGFVPSMLLSIVGAAIGSVIVYYMARLLGKDAVHMLFGEKKVTEMIDNMNSPKGLIITFVIFLIPGVPKDLCSYAAGLSDLKLKPYLIVSLIGRIPGMVGSLIIGHQVGAGGYLSAGIIAAAAVVLCVLGVIFRKKIIDLIHRATDRLLEM